MSGRADLPDLNVWLALATPTSDGWDVFHQLVAEGNHPARLCTDTYLAALAISNGWRLVSFDRGSSGPAGRRNAWRANSLITAPTLRCRWRARTRAASSITHLTPR
jgi:hypothetical protein